jgi:creatinine amidohydrolase
VNNFRYEELKSPEVGQAALQDPVVVLPVGTMEQHGPHMPLMVDYIIPQRIANEVAEQLAPNVIVMPPVVYSFNEHHMDFPGTIAINMYTIIDYVAQIGFSLAHHGFRHIVLLNGHGSNVPVMDLAMRRINNESAAISVLANYWALIRAEDLTWDRESHGVSHHADEDETSLMLYLYPHLVDMGKAVRTVEEVQQSEHIWGAWPANTRIHYQEFFSRNTSTGIQGDPTGASAEKGEVLYKAAVRRTAAFFEEFRAREIRPQRDFHPKPQG